LASVLCHESSSQPPITFCLYFNILLLVSLHQGFWPELFECFCILTYAWYMSPYVSSAQILPSKYLLRRTNHEIPHCAVFSILKSLLSWAHSLQHPIFKHTWYLCVIRFPFRCSSSLLSSAILRFVAGTRHFGTAWWPHDQGLNNPSLDIRLLNMKPTRPETSGISHPLTRLSIPEEWKSTRDLYFIFCLSSALLTPI
jgi:hypothetical protein